MMTLKTDRLMIEIADPAQVLAKSSRFEPAGYINEVVLDDKIRFCASEPKNLFHPFTGGRGLCCEYNFDVSQEASRGEYFPKMGVGLIRKPDDKNYIFYEKYDKILPFPVSYRKYGSRVVFKTQALPCMGYALEQEKILEAKENRLTITKYIKNTGEKTISGEEYCHNFLSIDGMALGPDYELKMPQVTGIEKAANILTEGKPSAFWGTDEGITLKEYLAEPSMMYLEKNVISKEAPFTWIMSERRSRASVTCAEAFSPGRIALWAVDHILSPEAFRQFMLRPGEAASWSRMYLFDCIL